VKMPCKSAAALSLLWTVRRCAAAARRPWPWGVRIDRQRIPTALHHLGRGKIESYWAARFEDVVQGTEAGGEALSLTLIEKRIGKDQALFRYKDDRGDPITLAIERRTATMSSILIDVGLPGPPLLPSCSRARCSRN